ncbi:MAG TPA: beta galactosidase jelly roll domain-containing protein [Terriglobales bacterium]|nr:beta galactosidase jelly roll domain-containing protein [Terriglobales bacterium]
MNRRLLLVTLCCVSFALSGVAATAQDLTELQSGWKMTSAAKVGAADEKVSLPDFDVTGWYPVPHMPATVLQVLADSGVYKDLYYGTNLTGPGDLWKQDWWYRAAFAAPPNRDSYSLVFKGINYRADIWLNGQKVATKAQAVGMYNHFEFEVTEFIHPGGQNVLAVKITPERSLAEDVELGDSWLDWINWKYIGFQDPDHKLDIPFVPDRNAGVWKRVYLSSTGAVKIRNPYVATDLPLPALSPAALTVYCDLSNSTGKPVQGTLFGEISRPGKPSIHFERSVSLLRNQTQEIAITPKEVQQLSLANPDLWWPYQWGKPDLYHLKLDFRIGDATSDAQEIDFGIRKVVQKRDSDESFPNLGSGGNFYLQINGRDYLVRGGVYSPDLLFRNDPGRDAAVMQYVKDLGLNLVRWELKIADDTVVDRADREGVPVMLGWMCCAQWEHWEKWTAEDHWVARASLRARLLELRSHPSVVIWASGSDGLPPDSVLNDYHQILREVHWQNGAVDTVSNYNRTWNGIHMVGPYVWRPPYYWFSEKYAAARGSSAEEGDNETIPPLESVKKFIPADKLWPINETWYFHSGANEGNNTLENVQRILARRYGSSNSVEEFTKKAQLAHYEDVRAQYESYATHWNNRKMTVHWMMNNPWPSFFGHLYDDYFKQGGGYFGAKKALRPLAIVWDYYATGDRSTAHIYVANLTDQSMSSLTASVAFYDLNGRRTFFKEAGNVVTGQQSSIEVMTVPRVPIGSDVYFVRLQLKDQAHTVVAENTYWQAKRDDDLGEMKNDTQFRTDLVQWSDMSALNTMPRAEIRVRGFSNQNGSATISLMNQSGRIAFFVRAELTKGDDGEEILPITYDDNYVTIFPHESRNLTAHWDASAGKGEKLALRVEGYNIARQVVDMGPAVRAGK